VLGIPASRNGGTHAGLGAGPTLQTEEIAKACSNRSAMSYH
jgi:hypothetical protein